MAVTGHKAGRKLLSAQRATAFPTGKKLRKSARKLRVHPAHLQQPFRHHAEMANAMMKQEKTAIHFQVTDITGARNR